MYIYTRTYVSTYIDVYAYVCILMTFHAKNSTDTKRHKTQENLHHQQNTVWNTNSTRAGT